VRTVICFAALFVCCLFDQLGAACVVLKSTLPLGVGQKLLGFDAPKGVRKFCEKFLGPQSALRGSIRQENFMRDEKFIVALGPGH
jgi:hypothetical protein